MDDRAYKEHLDEMTSSNQIDTYSDEKIEWLLSRLIKALPNEGKLYKYKSFANKESLSNTFDSLENGYIYLANPSCMNDDLDSTFYFDEESIEEVSKYLKSNSHLLLKWFFTNENNSIFETPLISSLGKEHVVNLFKYYEKDKNKINEFQGVDYLTSVTDISFFDAAKTIKHINTAIKHIYDSYDELADKVAYNFSEINKSKFRDMNKIYCLCSSYNNNSMWAKYADNKGICIEYDYNLLNNKSMTLKRLMISTFRVIYNNNKPKYSFLNDMKYMFNDNISKEENAQHIRNAVYSLITKEECWKNEEEWRIVLSVDYHKLFCDIVSKIYVTENLLETDEYLKLKNLCQKRGWTIIVRKTNKSNTGFEFE